MQCIAGRTQHVCVNIITTLHKGRWGNQPQFSAAIWAPLLCPAAARASRSTFPCRGLAGFVTRSLSNDRKWGRKPTCKRGEACRHIVSLRHADTHHDFKSHEVVCCMRGRLPAAVGGLCKRVVACDSAAAQSFTENVCQCCSILEASCRLLQGCASL